MKRKLCAGAITIVMSVGMAGPVPAKVPTAKITITGGKLTAPLEVTDARALGVKLGPWGGGFMDTSQGAVTEAPPEGGPYEVSFYTKPRGEVRKVYVVYYAPSRSAGQGRIYLPGKGEKWYRLNVSTIVRGGKDGKWHHASREWEALIKKLIAGAEAAQGLNSGT